MPGDDRDPKFERALAQHLRAGSAQAGCPDAETLAAYHERSMSLEEMTHWKQHISGCAACREALSLVEVTEKQLVEEREDQKIPVLEAAALQQKATRKPSPKEDLSMPLASSATSAPVVMAPRRPKLMRWAIPIGAVAAGVLVWIGIHEQHLFQAPPSGSVQVAENRPQATPEQSTNELATKTMPPAERDAMNVQMDERAKRQESEISNKELQSPRLVAPAAKLDALRKDAGGLKEEGAGKPASPAVAGAAAPLPPVSPEKKDLPRSGRRSVQVAPAAPQVSSTAQSAPSPTGAQAGGVAGNITAESDEKLMSGASKTKSALQQQAADVNTNAMMMKQGVSREMIQVSAERSGVVLTPDNKVWWKLGSTGAVELTTDAGKNWKTLHTGVTTQLTFGSAPSAKVCWIAGQAGTLLLTADRGEHWTKLNTPIAGDLGGVHALDAKHASIWDIANRQSYETSDAGLTWKQVANE